VEDCLVAPALRGIQAHEPHTCYFVGRLFGSRPFEGFDSRLVLPAFLVESCQLDQQRVVQAP
jgi:hypothetical protein